MMFSRDEAKTWSKPVDTLWGLTSVTSDAKVAKSLVRFKTDGSNDVLVVIDGGNNDYPDPARPGREGSKAVLNAFEIKQIK